MSPRILFTTLAAAVLACGSASAAVAAPAPAAPVKAADPVTHPERDFMGSTIRAHEKASPPAISPAVAGLPGLDVSGWQGNVNWSSVKANGAKFAYIKATENTNYQNGYFAQQYNGSYNVGLIRGAYHFATPNTSSGKAQADYFVAHGGGWSADGKTLPGLLDIEYNPYGATCYGLSHASMVSWIHAFINEYQAKTGRWAVIYSTTDWWTSCTGNNSGFGANDPLFIARYASTVGTLPAGWGTYTFWQHADSGTFPGDQDVFNGSAARLLALANNTP
jgi:GH25 family lysozyme M1 (1,4-beta-N-acetylmuramidase)